MSGFTPSASSSILSERQKDELHKSILDYFKTNNLQSAYSALSLEAGLEDFTPDPKAKYAGLLEKKWTSVIRLQKKIMEMETRLASLQEELAAAPSSQGYRQKPYTASSSTTPDPLIDITRLRVRSQGHHCLYPGATFKGTQKSERNNYDVNVTIVVRAMIPYSRRHGEPLSLISLRNRMSTFPRRTCAGTCASAVSPMTGPSSPPTSTPR